MDAKALALAQADRLISQYRGRKAQSDEEVADSHLLSKNGVGVQCSISWPGSVLEAECIAAGRREEV